jgi:hypothetical protein
MFGLIANGSNAFACYRKAREYQLSCYQAADDFFEDSDARRRWTRIAFDAALRNPGKRKRRVS